MNRSARASIAVSLVSMVAATSCAADTSTSASASTSTSLVAARPEEQYPIVRRTFAGMIDDGAVEIAHTPLDFFASPHPEGAVDLIDCATGRDFIGYDPATDPYEQCAGRPASELDACLEEAGGETQSDPTLDLADLAYEMASLRWRLRDLGYPPSVWGDRVDAMERLMLRAIAHDDVEPPEDRYQPYEELARELERYRQESGSRLRPVAVEGGCGAGEIGVTITTDPPGGRVRFIPVFFHELCRSQGLDPDDPRSCDRWREPFEDLLFDVSGDYVYHASWPDGGVRMGRLGFTNLEEGQTVTIRQAG